MALLATDGLSRSEANSVVAAGCRLMANGLAGAVGQGTTEDGAVFVSIMHPESGEPMFSIGKESGRYVVRGYDGGRIADGYSLAALSGDTGQRAARGAPFLRLVS